jgi:hypothetical protein
VSDLVIVVGDAEASVVWGVVLGETFDTRLPGDKAGHVVTEGVFGDEAKSEEEEGGAEEEDTGEAGEQLEG